MEEIYTTETGNPQPGKKPKAPRRTWIIVLLFLLLAIAGVIWCLLSPMGSKEEIPRQVYDGFIYNDGDILVMCVDEPIGSYNEELTPEEAAILLQDSIPDAMQIYVYPHYSPDDALKYVRMEGSTAVPDETISIMAMETYFSFEYNGEGEPVTSRCGEIDYILYRVSYVVSEGIRVGLAATTTVDGVDWLFCLFGQEPWESQMRADLEALLTAFAQDFPAGSEITALKPKGKPQIYTKNLTREQALEDPEFGAYVLTDVPSNLLPNYHVRTKSDYENSLECFWAEDYWSAECLEWHIRYYDGVNDYANAPLFFAEELTLADLQGLIEMVESGAFGRKRENVNFGVAFKEANIAIYIRAQDVDLEWLYEQIIALEKAAVAK